MKWQILPYLRLHQVFLERKAASQGQILGE